MSEQIQTLSEEILLIIRKDSPIFYRYHFNNDDDISLKLMVLRKIITFNKTRVLSILFRKGYFDFLATSHRNSFLFLVQQSLAESSIDTFEVLYIQSIEWGVQRTNDDFILRLAKENNQKVVNWIKAIDAYYTYKELTQLFQAGNALSARQLIEKWPNINEWGQEDNILIVEAVLKNDPELIQICLDYKLMPKIYKYTFEKLNGDVKLKLKQIYCYYYRIGLAYARYHVPFMKRLSKNLFGEIISYI